MPESSQESNAFLSEMLAGEMAGGVSTEERQEYLDATPEAFLRFARLLGCERMYRSEVYDELYSLLVSGYPRILILLPRGTYKSTALCISNTREILLNPNIRILYASETLAQAKGYLSWTRTQFEENAELCRIFGNMKPPRRAKRWGTEEIWVVGRTDYSKREATLTAKGLDQVRAGFHGERIIIDDPCSVENTRTKDSLNLTIDLFKHIFSIAEDVVDKESGEILHRTQLIASCTRYDDGDMLGYIKDMNKELVRRAGKGEKGIVPWKIIEEPAELKGGELPFKHLTREVLAQRLAEQGRRVYAAQMLLDPVPDEFAMFQRNQFKLIDARDIPKRDYLYTYLLVDTATGGEDDNDSTCAAVIGRDATGRDYVLDMVNKPMKPSEVVETVFSLYQKWGCRKLGMEKNMVNDVYGADIEQRCIRDQTRLRIQPIPGRTTESKKNRVAALQVPFENGTLYFSAAISKGLIHSREGLCYGDIPEQFIRFPRAKHDDIPDCLSDINKRDSRGALFFSRPRARNIVQPKAQIVNGKIVGNVQAEVKARAGSGDFWGKLGRQVGSRGGISGL